MPRPGRGSSVRFRDAAGAFPVWMASAWKPAAVAAATAQRAEAADGTAADADDPDLGIGPSGFQAAARGCFVRIDLPIAGFDVDRHNLPGATGFDLRADLLFVPFIAAPSEFFLVVTPSADHRCGLVKAITIPNIISSARVAQQLRRGRLLSNSRALPADGADASQ